MMMTTPYPLLSPAELDALRAQAATRSAELARELAWLDQVDSATPPETSAAPQIPSAETPFRIVVFNAERGNRFEGILALLREHPELRAADVLLLSEVDYGMARSGNRHVARELADALGLGYAFGIEFLELTKGDEREQSAAGDNTFSLHGNAILSRWPLSEVRVVRLPRFCDWAKESQQRIGGRMALLAEVQTAAGALTLASVHLENRTDPAGRRAQMKAVLDAIALRDSPSGLLSANVGGARAVIAGDLNTSTIDPSRDEQLYSLPLLLEQNPDRLCRPQPFEPLFDEVQAMGFKVDELNPAGVPTNVPFAGLDPKYWPKLDWIFARSLDPVNPTQVIPAEHRGERVSDHDFLAAHLRS